MNLNIGSKVMIARAANTVNPWAKEIECVVTENDGTHVICQDVKLTHITYKCRVTDLQAWCAGPSNSPYQIVRQA